MSCWVYTRLGVFLLLLYYQLVSKLSHNLGLRMSSSQWVSPAKGNGDRRAHGGKTLWKEGSIELVSISTIMHVEMWQT